MWGGTSKSRSTRPETTTKAESVNCDGQVKALGKPGGIRTKPFCECLSPSARVTPKENTSHAYGSEQLARHSGIDGTGLPRRLVSAVFKGFTLTVIEQSVAQVLIRREPRSPLCIVRPALLVSLHQGRGRTSTSRSFCGSRNVYPKSEGLRTSSASGGLVSACASRGHSVISMGIRSVRIAKIAPSRSESNERNPAAMRASATSAMTLHHISAAGIRSENPRTLSPRMCLSFSSVWVPAQVQPAGIH